MKRAIPAVMLAAVLAACVTDKPVRRPRVRDYSRALPPGASALREVPRGEPIPDPAVAWRHRQDGILPAIDESLRWFEAPSSRRFFPFGEVCTFEQAKASLVAFRHILTTSRSGEEFRASVFRDFDIWQSVGCDGAGTVLFTGYYAPVFAASRVRTARFPCPLYRRPADLVTDPVTGKPMGRRRPDGSIGPWPARREIEESGMLAGTELVWLEDPLSAYICHVNGSARLTLPGGQVLDVGYAGKTERPYRGLGAALVREGLVAPERLGLPAIRAAYASDPRRVLDLMGENESYVFFTEYEGKTWPAGSLGVRVTPRGSLATDKAIFPRGGVVLVSTRSVTLSRGKENFLRFMVDQDTGGAIQAPGRADIFMGIGRDAEVLAGGQYAEGRLYYFFLKQELVGRPGTP